MSRRVFLVFVLLLATACLISLVSEYGDAGLTAAPVADAQPAIWTAPAGNAAPSSEQTQAWAANIQARPLFAPGRRPLTDAPARIEATPQRLPRLTAVLVAGTMRSALFAATDGAKPVTLGIGDKWGGYTVEAIEPGQVAILGPDGRQVLRPTAQRRAARPPPAAVPSPGRSAAPAVMPGMAVMPGLVPHPAS